MNKPYTVVYEYEKNEAWAHRPPKWVVVRDEATVWAKSLSIAHVKASQLYPGLASVRSVTLMEGWRES